MAKKILITGCGGMFGQDAAKLFATWGYEVLCATKDDLDVTYLNAVEDFFEKKRGIDFVIHASAYTKVDDAQNDEARAFLVNGEGAKNIAYVTNKHKIALIYISTDYVFDGEKKSPYLPSDKTNPLNVYGASKLAGEENVKAENPFYYIARTSWLYGERGKNFVDMMIDLSKKQKTLRVVNDQLGCPTWTHDLAEMIKNLIEKKMPFGTYHLCNSGYTSWFGLAQKIFEILKIDIELIAVSSAEFLRPAKRPKFSAMNNANCSRSWDEALTQYLTSKKQ